MDRQDDKRAAVTGASNGNGAATAFAERGWQLGQTAGGGGIELIYRAAEFDQVCADMISVRWFRRRATPHGVFRRHGGITRARRGSTRMDGLRTVWNAQREPAADSDSGLSLLAVMRAGRARG